MKFLKLLLVVLLFLLPIGCQDISPEETVTRRGLIYKVGENEPFSGTVTGYSREGYRSQKMKFKKRYKNGVLHGDTQFWYPNGKLESVEPYRDGKINGVITRFYENGKIKSRIHIVNDQRGGSEGEQFWDKKQRRFGLF